MADFGAFMVAIADGFENLSRKDKDKEFFEQKSENVIDIEDAIKNRMEKEDVIQAMLVESIGHSILDSGGVYGRAYQRNRQKPHYRHAKSTLMKGRTFDRRVPEEGSYQYREYLRGPQYKDMTDEEKAEIMKQREHKRYLAAVAEADAHPMDWGFDSLYHHIGKWLEEHTGDVDYELTENFREWVFAQAQEDRYGDDTRYTNSTYSVEAWLHDEEWFPDQDLVTVGRSDNIYNYDNLISQVFQWMEFEIDREPFVAITVHGGADVRGGYGSIVIFEVDGDNSITDFERVVIWDGATGATWDSYQAGYRWDDHEGPNYEINIPTLNSLGIITRRDAIRAMTGGSRKELKTWTLKKAHSWGNALDEPDDWCKRWIEMGYLTLEEFMLEPATTRRAYDWRSEEYRDLPVEAKFAYRLIWNGETVSQYQYNWWSVQFKTGWFDHDLDKHLRSEDLPKLTWEVRHRASQIIAGERFDDFKKIYFADDPRDRWELWLFPHAFWSKAINLTGGQERSWVWKWLVNHPEYYRQLPVHVTDIPKPSYLWLLFKNRFLRFQMWARGGDKTRIQYLKPEESLLGEDGVFHSPYWPHDELDAGW